MGACLATGDVPNARVRTRLPMTPARATSALFFLSAVVLTAWGPLVPLAKARLALDEGGLGLLLLALGIGGVVAMPSAGGLIARYGYRRVIAVAMALGICVFPALSRLGGAAGMWAALLLFGAALGFTDVAMNLHASKVEKEAGRPMMSGFHGLWSVGAVCGSGAMSLMLGAGLSAGKASLVLSVLSALGLVTLLPGLSAGAPKGPRAPAFALPRGSVVALGALCFTVYLTEHSVLDWSAVYLATERGAGVGEAGAGFTLFAAAMTAMRLVGDRLRAALGDVRVVLLSGLTGAAGLVIVITTPSAAANLVGYAILGAGTANIVPVLFSAAGRSTAMPGNLGLTAVATISAAGLLVGPALIGFVAKATSLPTAFLLLAAGLVAVALSARAAAPEPASA